MVSNEPDVEYTEVVHPRPLDPARVPPKEGTDTVYSELQNSPHGATDHHEYPRPLAQCFETVRANEILEEMKGIITSTYGRILKLNSTKKDKDDISHLKEAKTSELKKTHAGQTPSEAQVLANISSSELANTAGGELDPPGVELYTQVGSGLQKGSTVLDVLRCGRGSVESFHQNTFIPGWRSNATHMLEGNMQLCIQRVLGCALLPEFIPTGERIAVEYLLAQSDRGDLLGPQQDGELGTIVPDRQVEEAEEEEEEECLDITSSDAVQILSQRPAVHHLTHHLR
ncbi:hypothetical protein KUCAC02_017016 [Chaenocephalus aceratus]|nr:hypothetical protein KUCAC02_017016 [Chaenocephalus aceratus]